MSLIPHKEEVKSYYNRLASAYDKNTQKNTTYHRCITKFVLQHVLPHKKVLDVGCATGHLLAAAQPSLGVGVDLSQEMIKLASSHYPQLTFVTSSIEEFKSQERFDYILLTDVLDQIYDHASLFEKLYELSHLNTKIIITTINPLWGPLLSVMEKLGAKMPAGPSFYVEKRYIHSILDSMDFTIDYSGYCLFLPKNIPLLSYILNTVGVKIPVFQKLACVQAMVIRPTTKNTHDFGLGCSVVIPCHNEEGNIKAIIERIPNMGKRTEILVVNDGSMDRTANIVEELKVYYKNLKLISYPDNRGKGYAVQKGFDAAEEEILMILDADLSVEPEELPRFFDPLNKGLCRFVNGTRMFYPMEYQAMRMLNWLGNKIFGIIMSFIIGQTLTDTLCGTKALYKSDYQHIEMGKDRWGDFDLLFGAAKLGNKIIEVPVHYRTRRTGESKMKPFRHAFHLLKACLRGFRELVFTGRRHVRH